MLVDVSIQEADFDIGIETAALRERDEGVGAIAQFVGVMRNANEGEPISEMYLEHYPGMTESSIKMIAEQAGERWALKAVRVIHRVGRLRPRDQIVFVATTAAHRHAAFQGCEFIMDFLKTRAPLWKKEILSDGRTRWVEARSSDDQALRRWED